MAVLTSVIRALIALLENCTLTDDDDFVSHTFYSTVTFVPEYPLGELDVPRVAFSPVGGLWRHKGLGHQEVWHRGRLQMDVLARNGTDARRIYEKVREVILWDKNSGAGTADGTYGKMYLYDQGLKEVEIGMARSALWDERIRRLTADVEVLFTD